MKIDIYALRRARAIAWLGPRYVLAPRRLLTDPKRWRITNAHN